MFDIKFLSVVVSNTLCAGRRYKRACHFILFFIVILWYHLDYFTQDRLQLYVKSTSLLKKIERCFYKPLQHIYKIVCKVNFSLKLINNHKIRSTKMRRNTRFDRFRKEWKMFLSYNIFLTNFTFRRICVLKRFIMLFH